MGLEEFGLDGSDAISADALERLMEQMRENAAVIKAIKQQEKKQRDKDNKLVAIIMKFIKGNQRQDLVALIIRLLNENVPASFILTIILLGNEEIQQQAGIILALPAGEIASDHHDLQEWEEQKDQNMITLEQKLVLKMWTNTIIATALENPYKILRTVKDAEGKVKHTAIQLTAFI